MAERGSAPRDAPATPEDEARAVVARWSEAFAQADVDAIVDLYAPDALFVGTSSRALVTRTEGIRAYFQAALFNHRPRTAVLRDASALVLSDTSVVISGLDTVTQTRDGAVVQAHGRVSFVIARRADAWKIVHFHRSASPGN